MTDAKTEQGYFITGTDTEIGKTYCSVQLVRQLCAQGHKVVALKPVASGCQQTESGLRNGDALQLIQAANLSLDYQRINRYAFEPAIAPHIAAAQASVDIDLRLIAEDLDFAASQADKVIVEAVGGWMVPLTNTESVADLAKQLQLPVIIVVGIRLGCINHALLTIEQIQSSGVAVKGWVANHIEPSLQNAAEQVEAIRLRTDLPCLAEFGFDHGANDRPARSATKISL